MKKNNLKFYCTEESVPMHFYESMQIFGAVFGMPEFIVNCGTEDSYLLNGDEKYVISVKNARADAPFAGDESDKNVLKRYLYKVLSEIYGYKSPWGVHDRRETGKDIAYALYERYDERRRKAMVQELLSDVRDQDKSLF